MHRRLVNHSQGQQSVVHGESAREAEEQCQDSSRHPLWHKRETNSLIAFRADARGPRATSGQGRAYSAARDDIPDRPALSANNGRDQCTILQPRKRDLTLHSKIAGPLKCSYRYSSYRSWFRGSPASPCLVVIGAVICRMGHDVLAHGETRPRIAPVEQPEMSKWAVILLLPHHPLFYFNQILDLALR
jgi:hypothetical protein